ncbi:uncharacterized protein LOC120000846 [Tripterygium wilfordii]|uniref:uncharacterized protein LOC120000846 n=1 Tax=Tripterygium wilfordii TaxID=458696 RepID=UPI0018F830E5|nr:uncharacterized protein LOC120000846 [Tripterygium wilfordii]
MAKLALTLAFLLSLTLSIHSALGAFEPAELLRDQFKDAATVMEGTTQSIQNNAVEMMDNAKDSSVSWTDWAKDKLEMLGFSSGSPSPAASTAEAPANAAAPSSYTFSESTGSVGAGPAGAPQAY